MLRSPVKTCFKCMRVIRFAMFDFDPSRKIADHLVGTNHSKWHRRSVGALIIVVGVGIAELPLVGPGHFIANAVGYLVHALGGLAFLSPIEQSARKDE